MNGTLDVTAEIEERYSPRLSGRFKKAYKDAKSGIIEDMVIYSLVIACSLLSDVLFNFCYSLGLSDAPHKVNLGMGQLIVALTFSVLLARKVAQWRYYS